MIVCKGDGFSFRYPADWEEGLAQAETTRALVRAISARTGYAASCNAYSKVIWYYDSSLKGKREEGGYIGS